ncbi:MAG: Ig-like domain-containing protein [Gemmatimonadota bacterium]|nr:Ig-like domain-containing protein [Gemmatimonadota bacterium]
MAVLMSLGETVQLSASVLDGNGQPVAGAIVVWSSSDEAVATVNAQGLVTAVGNGSVTVTARSGSVSASVPVSVMQSAGSIVIEPSEATLMSLGETVQLSATVLDGNGQPVSGAAVEWSSSDASVATVSGQGLVTAVGNGSAQITARSGSESASIIVTVSHFNAKEYVLTCPTTADIAEINEKLEIRFIDDPTADRPLLCENVDGSTGLTEIQYGAYSSLTLMRTAVFSEPLPWTRKSLWDWFVGTVEGIDFDGKVEYSHCCRDDSRIVVSTRIHAMDPDGRLTHAPTWLFALRDQGGNWYGATPVSWIQLFVHEARHAPPDGLPHTCGSKDQTFAEMGAWAYAWYTWTWYETRFEPLDFFDANDRAYMSHARASICAYSFCEGGCRE